MNDNTLTAGEIVAGFKKIPPNAPVYTLGVVAENGLQDVFRCNEITMLCRNPETGVGKENGWFDNPNDLYLEIKLLAERRLKERHGQKWEDDPKKWSPEQRAIYSEIADQNQTVYAIGWNGAKEKK